MIYIMFNVLILINSIYNILLIYIILYIHLSNVAHDKSELFPAPDPPYKYNLSL